MVKFTSDDEALIKKLIPKFKKSGGRMNWTAMHRAHFHDRFTSAQISRKGHYILEKQKVDNLGVVKKPWDAKVDDPRLIALVKDAGNAWKSFEKEFPGYDGSYLCSRFVSIDPAKKKGDYSREETRTLVQLARDLDEMDKVASTAAPHLNRKQKYLQRLMKDCIVPSLKKNCNLGPDGKFVIGMRGDFERVVDAVWKDVRQYNRTLRTVSNNVATQPLAEAKLAASVDHQNNHYNKAKRRANDLKAQVEAFQTGARITEQEKAELENKNTKQKWAKEAQAATKEILRIVPQEELDELNAFYESVLTNNPFVLATTGNKRAR